MFILLGSYVFYAWTDSNFLFLISAYSAFIFILGIGIQKGPRWRNALLPVGLTGSIGLLFFFKYYNFFISSLDPILSALHLNPGIKLLQLIIPIGISFFVFKGISYLIDIKREKMEAATDPVIFFAYMAFFPTLLAGPIEKAVNFIPQLKKKRVFDLYQAEDGMRQILWGMYKKMVVADNVALITNEIFENYQTLPGSTLFIGALLYTVQIYSDFSGYSDIAVGISKLLGFNITNNFNYPLFSQNIAEFWRKWHISLTSWLTEYVFIPLNISFRNLGNSGLILAILINFTIIGIWHGANWTYVVFGFLHGCYYVPLILKGTLNKKKRIAKDTLLPSFSESVNVIKTFLLVSLTFIIFRSDTVFAAFSYYKILFSRSLFHVPVLHDKAVFVTSILFLFIMFIVEWFQREREHGLQIHVMKSSFLRMGIYMSLILVIVFLSGNSSSSFIYFKF